MKEGVGCCMVVNSFYFFEQVRTKAIHERRQRSAKAQNPAKKPKLRNLN